MNIVRIPVGFLLEFFRAFLNGIHILFEAGQLSVSVLQLLLFICQLLVDSLQFFFQSLNPGCQFRRITAILLEVLLGCRQQCLFFGFRFFKITNHGCQPFYPTFCQTDVRLKFGESFPMSADILLNGCTFFGEHTAIFFGIPVTCAGFGYARSSRHSPLGIDFGEKVSMELFHPRTVFKLVLSGEYLLVRKATVLDWQKRAVNMGIRFIQMYNESGYVLFAIFATHE